MATMSPDTPLSGQGPGVLTQVRGDRFFRTLGWIFLAIAVLGFLPTYWIPVAKGTFGGRNILHLHGILMFCWVSLYVFQTHLIGSGRVGSHRAWGITGVALLSAIGATIVVSALNSITKAESIGMGDQARAFSLVSLGGAAFIGGFVGLAIAYSKYPDWHKRLMALSFVLLLEAPMARPFAVALTPPDAVGPPPVFVTFFPALVIDLIIFALAFHDRRTLGNVHRATIYGGLAIVGNQAGTILLANTPAWLETVRLIEAIAR